MSANVQPEEVEALLGGPEDAESARIVSSCDFRRPRRLGPAQILAVEDAVRRSLPDAESALTDVVGESLRLHFVSLSETHAALLFAQTPDPLVALRFRSAGQPSWVLWDSLPAIHVIERILGSTSSTKERRRLSCVEARVLEELLGTLAETVLRPLGHDVEDPTVVQGGLSAGSWRDADDGADPHRLSLELALEAGEDSSTIHLFLSGFQRGIEGSPRRSKVEDAPTLLPGHLRSVEIELHVCLPGIEIPLAQLLALEEGDVIPLGVRRGDPAIATVGDRLVATADWGIHHGRLAARIRSIDENQVEQS